MKYSAQAIVDHKEHIIHISIQAYVLSFMP